MKQIVQHITALLLFALVLMQGCVERISIDTDNQTPQLIIASTLTTDNVRSQVHITQSTTYFGGNTCPPVLNAKVWINDQVLALTDSSKGTYTLVNEMPIEVGGHYKLMVHYDFDGDGVEEEYWAEDMAPEPMQLLLINLLPVSNGADTSIYAPKFLINGLIQRSANQHYIGFEQYVNGVKRKIKLSQSLIAEVPLTLGTTFVPPFGIYSIGRGGFYLEGSTDTFYYAPFDTIGVQVLSLSQALFDFKFSAQNELNNSNPLFGGPPANAKGNIVGTNVRGYFGIAAANPPTTLILPMNAKTLDGQYYISLVDSTTKIQVQNSGTAHYVNGDKAGQLYFHNLQVDATIRGFHAVDASGAGLSFTMTNYNEFTKLDDENIAWRRTGRIP
ncbi:MAG: DUF4249 family protein [Bacteroidales bacterium]